jgi:hypothetical protein
MKEEMDQLEEELNADMRSSQMAFSKEKEKIKSEMMVEYENKIQNEIEKLNKDHQAHKAEIEDNEKKIC